MGESQKVACAVPLLRILTGLRFPERSQRRLRRMKTPAKARKPLWEYGQKLASVCFFRAPNDKIIGKADQETVALHPWSHVALKPFIQDMMQEDIG
jgi:hypothetical protein